MIVIEVLVVGVVFGLAVVMTWAMYIGLLGILGVVRLVRCDRCGHLGVPSSSAPLRACAHCRHGALLHPLETLHHAHVPHWHRGTHFKSVAK